MPCISQFQNRRAKQKKIDSRAQKAAERTTSPPSPLVGGPVLLNAPQQLSASSFASSTGFSECSVPSVPSYGPPSGYSIAYTPSSISSRYSDIHEVHQLSQQDHYEGQPFGSTIPYYPTAVSSTLQESYPPYVQCSYFPDVSSDYSQTPFAYQPVEEKAFLPSFSGNVMNSGLVGQDSSSDAWASRQSRPLAVALDGLNTPVSVSPASSKSSSLDENLPAPRVRNGMPHVLSNLGGLSIVPYPDNVASQEPIYAPGAMPVISSTLPPAYGTAMVPPSWQSMPNGMPSVPPHSLNDNFGATSYSSPVVAGPSMISPTSTTFPAPPMGPSAAPPSAIPHYGGGAAGYPYSHSVSTDSKVVQPMSSQTVQPSEQGLQSAIPLAVPLDMSHVSATLAARRQSLQAYPGDKALPRVSTLQQQSRQGMLPSIPKGFSMMDDSSLPLRRASMSAMNSNTPIPRHQSSSYAAGPLDPERQAVLDSAAQAVLPLLASPPLMLETGVHQSPKSPAHLKSERGASATTASSLAHPAFEDTPILGGLRRGSIPKKVKSPTSTYSPYPQIHMRRASEQVNSRLT